MNIIRKISIGQEYKDNAMHYSVGQRVYGDHIISDILYNDVDNSYIVFIEKNKENIMWKRFNCNMAIAIEYNINF